METEFEINDHSLSDIELYFISCGLSTNMWKRCRIESVESLAQGQLWIRLSDNNGGYLISNTYRSCVTDCWQDQKVCYFIEIQQTHLSRYVANYVNLLLAGGAALFMPSVLTADNCGHGTSTNVHCQNKHDVTREPVIKNSPSFKMNVKYEPQTFTHKSSVSNSDLSEHVPSTISTTNAANMSRRLRRESADFMQLFNTQAIQAYNARVPVVEQIKLLKHIIEREQYANAEENVALFANNANAIVIGDEERDCYKLHINFVAEKLSNYGSTGFSDENHEFIMDVIMTVMDAMRLM
jgi:hypothetical protein